MEGVSSSSSIVNPGKPGDLGGTLFFSLCGKANALRSDALLEDLETGEVSESDPEEGGDDPWVIGSEEAEDWIPPLLDRLIEKELGVFSQNFSSSSQSTGFWQSIGLGQAFCVGDGVEFVIIDLSLRSILNKIFILRKQKIYYQTKKQFLRLQANHFEGLKRTEDRIDTTVLIKAEVARGM